MSLSLSHLLMEFVESEGRFVVASGERSGRGSAAPWVVLGLGAATAGTPAIAAATAAAAESAASAAAAAAALVHLRGRVAQRRADLVDLNLDDGALLALSGLEGTLLESSAENDP